MTYPFVDYSVSERCFGMNSFSLYSMVFVYFFSFAHVYGASKTVVDYLQDIKSEEISIAKEACRQLGKQGKKKYVANIVDAVKEQEDVTVKIACISALSSIRTKGEPTNSLVAIFREDPDSELAYVALLSLINVRDLGNPTLKELVNFIQESKIEDSFIQDVVVKLDPYIKK